MNSNNLVRSCQRKEEGSIRQEQRFEFVWNPKMQAGEAKEETWAQEFPARAKAEQAQQSQQKIPQH
jgi:hypothetical protein